MSSLEQDIVRLSVTIAKATHELLVKIRLFDASGDWKEQGFLSCAHWLNARVGIDLRTAREKVRVAHALVDLPKTDEAFAKGALTYSHTRALSRVGTAENEEKLIAAAQTVNASAFEKLIRNADRTKRDGQSEAAKRSFAMITEEDGMVVLRCRMRADEAAVVRKALEAVQQIPAKGETVDRVQALVDVAERSLSDGSREQRTDDRYQVVLHLERDHAHIEGEAVSQAVSDRILCDASIVEMLQDKNGNILSVGRKTRAVPLNIKRAVSARDHQHCAFPGCTNRFVDAHHIKAWEHGGKTSKRNLTSLCRAHHQMIHENRFCIEGTGDAPRFIKCSP